MTVDYTVTFCKRNGELENGSHVISCKAGLNELTVELLRMWAGEYDSCVVQPGPCEMVFYLAQVNPETYSITYTVYTLADIGPVDEFTIGSED